MHYYFCLIKKNINNEQKRNFQSYNTVEISIVDRLRKLKLLAQLRVFQMNSIPSWVLNLDLRSRLRGRHNYKKFAPKKVTIPVASPVLLGNHEKVLQHPAPIGLFDL